MDFEFTEEQELIRQVAREFAETEIRPVVGELDEKGEYPEELAQKCVEMGFRAMGYPEEYGGAGGGFIEQTIIIEELCKVTGQGPNIGPSPLAYGLILSGRQNLIDKYLPDFLEGKTRIAMGWTEPNAGSDSGNVQTTAVKDGDEWVLNGNKCFITGSSWAHVFYISARTVDENGKEGISVFVVDRDMPGFQEGAIEKKYWWRGSGTGDIYLKDLRVPANHMIGEVNEGPKIVAGVLEMGRLMCATSALGLAEGALAQATEYAKQREQFGRPIAKFQVIQHMLADMSVMCEAARLMVYRAAAMRDAGKPMALEASYAKLFTTEIAKRACDDAMQICGGMGLDMHFGIDRYYRDARTMSISEGTSQIQRHIISKSLLK